MSTTTTVEPAAWIGCLECYNAGCLVGDWYPASRAGGITTDQIHGCLVRAGTHEELWVMDHEGLPIAGECSPADVQERAEVLGSVEEWQLPALCAWIASGDYVCEGRGDIPSLPDFEERYAGEWSSFREYAESLADVIGLLADAPEELARYFDWSAWVRDLAHDHTTQPAPGGGLFVFRVM